jgi:Arc/MetJ-type ribon-helix-helix transcriptional regulator
MQVRVLAELLGLIDKLVEKGVFKSRTDFMLESIRLLITRYFPESAVRTTINRTLRGKAASKPYTRILSEEERRKIAEFFANKNASEVSMWSRVRNTIL